MKQLSIFLIILILPVSYSYALICDDMNEAFHTRLVKPKALYEMCKQDSNSYDLEKELSEAVINCHAHGFRISELLSKDNNLPIVVTEMMTNLQLAHLKCGAWIQKKQALRTGKKYENSDEQYLDSKDLE
jgi:hypothetical protein